MPESSPAAAPFFREPLGGATFAATRRGAACCTDLSAGVRVVLADLVADLECALLFLLFMALDSSSVKAFCLKGHY